MTVETCPLLNEIPWIRHGFFNQEESNRPEISPKDNYFSDEYPNALFLIQTHSDKICTDKSNIDADASITDENDLALVIKTADCCPVLVVCTTTRLIANIHAGWPGALNKITSKTITAMVERGAKPETMIAAIGPCIHH